MSFIIDQTAERFEELTFQMKVVAVITYGLIWTFIFLTA